MNVNKEQCEHFAEDIDVAKKKILQMNSIIIYNAFDEVAPTTQHME